MNVRIGKSKLEEYRCLLVARLKVCSVAERGTGGGGVPPPVSQPVSQPRGVGSGGQQARGW